MYNGLQTTSSCPPFQGLELEVDWIRGSPESGYSIVWV